MPYRAARRASRLAFSLFFWTPKPFRIMCVAVALASASVFAAFVFACIPALKLEFPYQRHASLQTIFFRSCVSRRASRSGLDSISRVAEPLVDETKRLDLSDGAPVHQLQRTCCDHQRNMHRYSMRLKRGAATKHRKE